MTTTTPLATIDKAEWLALDAIATAPAGRLAASDSAVADNHAALGSLLDSELVDLALLGGTVYVLTALGAKMHRGGRMIWGYGR